MIHPELTNIVVEVPPSCEPSENPTERKCPNHIRGCRNVLTPDYPRSKCEDCLRTERERDKKRRDAAKAKQAEATENETTRICTTCCVEFPTEHFCGVRANTLTKTCQACRESNKKQDEKRDKDHRNELERLASKKPERIAKKKEWVEQNHEKRAEYWQRTRQRYIANNIDEYLRRNAENAKRWRDENPEKYRENLIKTQNSVKTQWTNYHRVAFQKNVPWELKYEEFENLVHSPCYYCGEFNPEKTLNSIGRKNLNENYCLSNTVTSCQICCMIKNTMNQTTFIKRVKHILSFQQIVEQKYKFTDAFPDYNGGTYNDYKKRAENKNLEFSITISEYNAIIHNDCYICGKFSTSTHRNGIDRYDDTLGYTVDNSYPCCANCNYMKKQYSFQNFIDRLRLIYEKHQNTPLTEENMTRCLAKGNKKTAEELLEHSKQLKMERTKKLMEKYTDEEIKKNAIRIAEERRAKKQNL